jgi:hypothetical protein
MVEYKAVFISHETGDALRCTKRFAKVDLISFDGRKGIRVCAMYSALRGLPNFPSDFNSLRKGDIVYGTNGEWDSFNGIFNITRFISRPVKESKTMHKVTTNDVPQFPELGNIKYGSMFRYPQGTNVYMKLAYQCRFGPREDGKCMVLTLKNGIVDLVKKDKRVSVLEKGIMVNLEVGEV